MIYKNNEIKLINLIKNLESKKIKNENKINDLISDHFYFLETSLDFFRRNNPKTYFETLSPFYLLIGNK